MLIKAAAGPSKNLFLVAPSKRDRRYFKELSESPYNVHTLEPEGFEYLRPSENFDVERYLDQCRAYIKSHSIDGLLFSHDISVLFASRLGQEFNFATPSVESVFLATHKQYSRMMERSPIESIPFKIWSDSIDEKNINYPCYVKPPLLVFSKFQQIVNNKEGMLACIEEAQKFLPKWNSLYYKFIEKYVDLSKYEGGATDMLLIEEVVRKPQFCVEGYSIGDRSYIWAVSDSIYSRDGRIALDYYMTPSTLSPEHLLTIRNASQIAVSRHGLKNTFWNVEIWFDGNETKITEINPRSASVWHWLYQGSYDTSLYMAMMHLSAGEYEKVHTLSPENLVQKPKVAMQFHVVTYQEGPAISIVNFEAAKGFPQVQIEWLTTPESMVKQEQTGGAIVARFEIYADDAHACYQQAYEIRKAILRDMTTTPYDSPIDPILERDQILYANSGSNKSAKDSAPASWN